MKSLFGHFQLVGRKERRVLNLISDHLNIVIKTVQQLEPLFEYAKQGDWKQVNAVADKVAEFETLADSLHRDAVLAISQGAFFSGTRDDFLELMELNDNIADAAENASRIIADSPMDTYSFLILYEEPAVTLSDLFTKLESSVILLAGAINSLESDSEIAVSKSLLVERAEEDADEIKRDLVKRIFVHKADLEVLTLLQLRDFVLKLDDIADAAEDASDLVISLVAKAEA
jgi:predicted phosphate transport protein (TIGR00153 family)